MKNIFFMFWLITGQLHAQNFDGVYSGKIFSESNVFVLTTTGSNAVGTIYLNKTEKVIFIGSINGSKLIGSVQKDGKSQDITGELRNNDTLILFITGKGNGEDIRLKRISQNTSINVNKLLKEADNLDMRLLGSWRLVSVERTNGTQGPPESNMRGFSYEFKRGGFCIINSPLIEKTKREHGDKVGFKVPISTWSTNGEKLFISTQGSGSSERMYQIKGDTLITIHGAGKNFFIRTSH